MTKRLSQDTRFISLPTKLVQQLREVSYKRGTNLTAYSAGALEEALRAESMGASLSEAVDAFEMDEIHRGAGAMTVLRSSLDRLVEADGGEGLESLTKLWGEAGRWYGHYLASKLPGKNVLPFFEKDLKASWGLDETEVMAGDEVVFRFICFMMSERFTELLLSYVSGVMDALGYRESDGDRARGMATIKFSKIPK